MVHHRHWQYVVHYQSYRQCMHGTSSLLASVVAVERVSARCVAALAPVVHVAVEPFAGRLDDIRPHHKRRGTGRPDVVVPSRAGLDGNRHCRQLPAPHQLFGVVVAVAGAAPHLQAGEVGGMHERVQGAPQGGREWVCWLLYRPARSAYRVATRVGGGRDGVKRTLRRERRRWQRVCMPLGGKYGQI